LARSYEQSHAKFSFKRLKGATQCGLADVQPFCGLLQAAGFMHHDEAAQMLQFHGVAWVCAVKRVQRRYHDVDE